MPKTCLFILQGLLISCCCFSQSNSTQTEVVNALNNYFDALRAHDVQKAISYFANTKDFLIFSGGKANSYAEYTNNVRTNLSTFKSVDISYDTLYTRPISEQSIWITGPFHENITDANGKELAFNVTASLIFVKHEGQWKITYATAVYQPVIDEAK